MEFVPGRELCRRFYFEAVRPLLESTPHAAALLDGGSEVLGFDTEMSMDHGWGPRVQLFFPETPAELGSRLAAQLPRQFAGLPVFVSRHPDGSFMPDAAGAEHRVEAITWSNFRREYLGIKGDPEAEDWLWMPMQHLRTVAEGPIFHDEIGLAEARAALAWYPIDMHRYLLACLWQRIGQEEHLVGRAGFVGDELGAKVIAARLVRDLMRIGFLLEKKFPPYAKWFGTAFGQLRNGPALETLFTEILDSQGWKERDAALRIAFEYVAHLQNNAELCPLRPVIARDFYSRPFGAIELHAGFADALIAAITDPAVNEIAARGRVGSIDLFSDSTDLLEQPLAWRRSLTA